jgi:hypothetical protein
MNENGTQIGALALDLHALSFLCVLCALCGLFLEKTTRPERTTKNENRTQIFHDQHDFSLFSAPSAHLRFIFREET